MVRSVLCIIEPCKEECDDDTAFVRIVRCFGVKKSFRKLSVMGLPLAKMDLRTLSNVHFPTSTGIPSNATKRAMCEE